MQVEAIALFPNTANEDEAQTKNLGTATVKSFCRKMGGGPMAKWRI